MHPEDGMVNQMPNFLSKDGKLYSFEGSNYVDHPPMMLNDGRVVSFDKINNVSFYLFFLFRSSCQMRILVLTQLMISNTSEQRKICLE